MVTLFFPTTAAARPTAHSAKTSKNSYGLIRGVTTCCLSNIFILFCHPVRNKVTINYKQYALQKPGKPPPIGKMEFEEALFLQRFAQHFMPSHFHKVRYYGCYSFGAKNLKATIYSLITGQQIFPYQAPAKRDLIKKMLGHHPDVCTNCGVFNPFVTEKIFTDPYLLFILTRPNHTCHIRAGPTEEFIKSKVYFSFVSTNTASSLPLIGSKTII